MNIDRFENYGFGVPIQEQEIKREKFEAYKVDYLSKKTSDYNVLPHRRLRH